MDDEKIKDDVESQDQTSPTVTYTQVASCIYGPTEEGLVDRRRNSLRAKLERENYERQLKKQKSLINTFRNLFGSSS
jgi:hypothetical protein